MHGNTQNQLASHERAASTEDTPSFEVPPLDQNSASLSKGASLTDAVCVQVGVILETPSKERENLSKLKPEGDKKIPKTESSSTSFPANPKIPNPETSAPKTPLFQNQNAFQKYLLDYPKVSRCVEELSNPKHILVISALTLPIPRLGGQLALQAGLGGATVLLYLGAYFSMRGLSNNFGEHSKLLRYPSKGLVGLHFEQNLPKGGSKKQARAFKEKFEEEFNLLLQHGENEFFKGYHTLSVSSVLMRNEKRVEQIKAMAQRQGYTATDGPDRKISFLEKIRVLDLKLNLIGLSSSVRSKSRHSDTPTQESYFKRLRKLIPSYKELSDTGKTVHIHLGKGRLGE